MINYKDEYIKKCYELDMALNEIGELKQKLNLAIDVIGYYADTEYWGITNGNDQDENNGYLQGKKARRFLKELSNES